MAKTTATPLALNEQQLKDIGQKLRVARERKNLSQLEVAKKAFNMEVSHCKVSRLERGTTRQPSRQQIAAVARVLRVPMSQLIAA